MRHLCGEETRHQNRACGVGRAGRVGVHRCTCAVWPTAAVERGAASTLATAAGDARVTRGLSLALGLSLESLGCIFTILLFVIFKLGIYVVSNEF